VISDLDITVRLLLAAVLSSVIGFERERHLWAAGIRTHMLVCVGSCLLMIVSAYGFQHVLAYPHIVLDPSRVAAQVVSGIGFLGAGSILLRGQVVRGLTTAASIWAVAAIGLACGGRLFYAATASTLIILLILAGIKPLEEAYRARVQSCTLEIETTGDPIEVAQLKKLLGVRANQIKRIHQQNGTDGLGMLEVQLVRVSREEIERVTGRLERARDVVQVKVMQAKTQQKSRSGSD
jgi:putative Mg2+ transporter-C (MgtC) family protein